MEELPLYPRALSPPPPLARPLPPPSYREIPPRPPLPTRPTFTTIPADVRRAYIYNRPAAYSKLARINPSFNEFARSPDTLRYLCEAPIRVEEVIKSTLYYSYLNSRLYPDNQIALLQFYAEPPAKLERNIGYDYRALILRGPDNNLSLSFYYFQIDGDPPILIPDHVENTITDLPGTIRSLYRRFKYILPSFIYQVYFLRYSCEINFPGYAMENTISHFNKCYGAWKRFAEVNSSISNIEFPLSNYLIDVPYLLGQYGPIDKFRRILFGETPGDIPETQELLLRFIRRFLPTWILQKMYLTA